MVLVHGRGRGTIPATLHLVPHDHLVLGDCRGDGNGRDAKEGVFLAGLGETPIESLGRLAQMACHHGLAEPLPLLGRERDWEGLVVDVGVHLSPIAGRALFPTCRHLEALLGILLRDINLAAGRLEPDVETAQRILADTLADDTFQTRLFHDLLVGDTVVVVCALDKSPSRLVEVANVLLGKGSLPTSRLLCAEFVRKPLRETVNATLLDLADALLASVFVDAAQGVRGRSLGLADHSIDPRALGHGKLLDLGLRLLAHRWQSKRSAEPRRGEGLGPAAWAIRLRATAYVRMRAVQ